MDERIRIAANVYRRHGSALSGQYDYELRLLIETPTGSAENQDGKVQDALAEVMAGRVEGKIWKTADDLSEQQELRSNT
jgi:hypothetical protein